MIEQLNKIADVWWAWMWPMSWQVSVLVVFIGVADFFLRKRVWPQVRYALWLLIIVKLILPPTFSLSTSIVSQLRPWAEQAIMQQPNRSEFPVVADLHEDLTVEKPVFDTQNLASALVAEAALATGAGANGDFSTAPAGAPARPSWQVYVMLVWLLGVLILATWLMMRFRQLRSCLCGKADETDLPDWLYKLLAETAKKLNLKHLPEVMLSQNVACPAVFGVLRPVLLLPRQNIAQISRKDTEHILLHELAHIKRGDLWVHGVYMVLQLIYWFNPLLWLVRRKLQHLRELCCDATVAAILREKIADYRETILQTAKWLLDKPKISGIGILGLVEGPSRLLIRLNWLEKKTWRYQKMKSLIVITTVSLMITFVLPMAKAQKSEKTDTRANIEQEQKSAKSLHQAAEAGDIEQVKSLISKGADVNAKDDDGWSPLHYAAKKGHRDVVRLLIANGADVNAENAENEEYETPLYFAAKYGHKDVAEILIAKGADVNARGGWGATPLYYSAEHGKKDVAELLIAKGADVNARDMWGESVLWAACWSGHGDVAELLVAKGADVNAKDMWGLTPLYYATWYKPDRDTAKLLIDNGADVNFVREGNSYLHYTVRKDNIELTKLLVNNGAKLDVKDYRGYTPFSYAVAQGNREIIELFVSKGTDVSTFHKAACVGDLNRVKLFVQRGADVNEKDELGWAPLLFAASLGQTEVAEFLVDNGANIHAKISDGRTALHQALQVGAAKLAKLLIAKGADVNAKTAKGQTPLHEAVRTEHGRKLEVISVIEELIAKGADVNAKNNDGCTPMHLTAMKGHTNVAELLLSKGANVNAMNKYGYTPLHFALWPGYSKEFVEWLRKHGAKE